MVKIMASKPFMYANTTSCTNEHSQAQDEHNQHTNPVWMLQDDEHKTQTPNVTDHMTTTRIISQPQ